MATLIGRVQRDFLASFAPTVELDVEALGRTLFCHGSPRSDDEAITTVTPEDRLHRLLDGVEARIVVCGHTRAVRPSAGRTASCKRGQRRDAVRGRPGARWLLLGPDVDLRRADYDVETAIERLRATGCPDVEEFLQHSFLEPIEPGWVSEFFERQAQQAERSAPP